MVHDIHINRLLRLHRSGYHQGQDQIKTYVDAVDFLLNITNTMRYYLQHYYVYAYIPVVYDFMNLYIHIPYHTSIYAIVKLNQ